MPSLGRFALVNIDFFAGVGVLLLAAKDVAASQDILVDIFGRIESFFVRLDSYTEVPLTPAMTEKMEITVEVLDILATATKEMEQSRAKTFVQKVAGRTDLGDGPRKLDKLTNEEVAMASVQFVKVTHNIDNKVTGIDDGVRGVDVKVQVVNNNVKARRLQFYHLDGKATATEVKSIPRQTADDVDDARRNQLRDNLRKWQSPPDPSTNHNIAGDRQREGIMGWVFESNQFESWKVTGSLLVDSRETYVSFTCGFASSVILWTPRFAAGSGKAVLCSAIINDLEAGSGSMAYFYFDFRDIDLTKHLIVEYPQHVKARVDLTKSPLPAALYNQHIRVAELLYQHGAVLMATTVHIDADANAKDNDHRTPLHLAAAGGLSTWKLFEPNWDTA
ncbi:hypothetical protein EDB85DRAFT_2140215 [Lactarius pseudohatsudake]|nr:hypothetical protein EDB85DRAFT_2140215 [Lactarius pseudohatsudake]